MTKTSTLLSEYQNHTRDTTSANQSTGQTRMQFYYTQILALTNNYVAEMTKYGSAVANQRSYLFPPGLIKIKTIRFYLGSKWYEVTEEMNLSRWYHRVATIYTSSIPTHYRVFNERGNLHYELDPIPSDSGTENIEIVYEGQQDPLTFPGDYNAGTVSIAKGSNSVVGLGTVFTTGMVSRFLQISGGKFWYDILSFSSTTSIALVNYFQEPTVAGSGYTIAEIPRIPEEYHMTLVWGAVMDYYMPNNSAKYKEYKDRYDRDIAAIEKKYQNKTKGAVEVGIPVSSRSYSTPLNYPKSRLFRV